MTDVQRERDGLPAEPMRMRRWRWRLSLRARLSVLATAVLAIGLGAGGALLVGTISATLLSTVDSGARQTAREVAALVDSGGLPNPIPVAGPAQLVQVVDSGGRVRAASAGTDRLVPLLRPAETAQVIAGQAILIEGKRLGLDAPMRVLGASAGPPNDRQSVIVAVGVGDVLEGQVAVRNAVLIGCPVLLVGLGSLSWLVVGATLRPVEALRASAVDITGTGADRRLPVPDADDEVHRLAVTLNDMLSRLEAARDRQRAFVADAAHELRSPLTSLRTQLEIAGRRSPDLRTEDLLAETERLSRLVDDLLLLARLDASGGPAARSAEVDLAAMARTVARRYADGAVPVTVAAAGAALVTGDHDRLARVLANLLDNAVRYAASQVELTVDTVIAEPVRKPKSAGSHGKPSEKSNGKTAGPPPPAEVVVTVTDDGPGIPAADRERVFERFTRLDDARGRDSGGVGLGLAIVKDLVRAHNGTVVFIGAPTAPGLRAVVRLPAATPGTDE